MAYAEQTMMGIQDLRHSVSWVYDKKAKFLDPVKQLQAFERIFYFLHQMYLLSHNLIVLHSNKKIFLNQLDSEICT